MTVDEYLAAVGDDWRASMDRLRADCRELLVGFDEEVKYGMPSYLRDGEVEVAFARQKHGLSLYVLRTDVLAAHRDRLDGIDVGKGAIRYRSPDQIDRELVRSMLAATAGTTGPIC